MQTTPRYSPISTPNSTACRSAFQRASSGKVKNIGASDHAPVMFSKRSQPGTQEQGPADWGPHLSRVILPAMCGRARLSSDVSEIKLRGLAALLALLMAAGCSQLTA